MRVLLLFVVLAAIVAGIAIWVRRRAQTPSTRPPVDPFRADEGRVDPREIKVGDVVAVEGSDFVVRGTLRFEQAGFTWAEHFIDDVQNRRWLSVEDDEGLELCLWERQPAATAVPGAAEVEFGGVTYRLDEHGDATYTSEGTTGTAPSGQFEYYDYEAGHRRLGFERFGTESWEVSAGRLLTPREVQVFPTTA